LREVGQGGPGEISLEGFLSGRKNIFEGRMDTATHGALAVRTSARPGKELVIFHGSINVL